MKKTNLGKSNSVVSEKLDKNNLFVDEKKSKKVVYNIDKNLELIADSMTNIEKLLNKTLSTTKVSSSRIKVFRLWSRKCKSQANSAEKLREKLVNGYEEDVRTYPLKKLEEEYNDKFDEFPPLNMTMSYSHPVYQYLMKKALNDNKAIMSYLIIES